MATGVFLAVLMLTTAYIRMQFIGPTLALIFLISVVAVVKRPIKGVFFIFFSASVVFLLKRLMYADTGALQEFGNPFSIFFSGLSLVVFCVALYFMLRRLAQELSFEPSEVFLLLLVSIYLIAGVFSPSAEAFIYGFKATLFPLFMIVVGRYVVTYETYSKILSAKVFLGFAVLGYGIKQGIIGFFDFEYDWAVTFAGINNIAWFLSSSEGKVLRVFSTLSDPFDFAVESMLMLVLAAVMFVEKSRKALFFALAGVAVIGLYLTGIRGAWVGAMAGLTVALGFFSYKRRWFKAFVFASIVIGSWGIAFVQTIESSSPMVERVRSLANPLSVHQMSSRYENWADAIESTKSNPMGTGLGSSGFIGRTFSPGAENVIVPDSLYVQALIEAGWLAAFLLPALLAYIAVINLRRYLRETESTASSVYLVTASSVIAVAVHGFTTPIQETNAIIWCWLLLGVADMFNVAMRKEKHA